MNFKSLSFHVEVFAPVTDSYCNYPGSSLVASVLAFAHMRNLPAQSLYLNSEVIFVPNPDGRPQKARKHPNCPCFLLLVHAFRCSGQLV